MQVRRDIRPESRAIDSTLNTTAFQGTVIFDRCPQVAFLLHSSAHLVRGSLAWRFRLSRYVRISKTSKSKLGTCWIRCAEAMPWPLPAGILWTPRRGHANPARQTSNTSLPVHMGLRVGKA